MSEPNDKKSVFDVDTVHIPESARANLQQWREQLPVSVYSRIAEISLYYEQTWSPERVLSIEKCLEMVSEDEREDLFERLYEIDLYQGFSHRAALPQQNYLDRFPLYRQIIVSVYNHISKESIVVNTDRIGKKIEHYRIDGIIGKGGMGIVYKAFDEPFDRYVAIKYLLPKFAKFQDSNDRFLREIRLMGQLPSDIPFAHAYFYGKDENASYLVMEYVDGVDLAAYVKKKTDLRKTSGPLSWREAVSYIQQAADGLKRIHRLGIVHRDIKPENIIVNKDGKIKILDLGLSSFFDPSEHLQNDHKITTESGVNHIEGTPAYLPPEVYTSSDTNNCQSDIYCLGGTLFFLLTGKLPNSWYDPLSQRDLIPTVSIKEFFQKHSIKNIPDSLLNILEKMLEPDCKKRYQNADAVCDDLQNLVAEEKKSRRRKKQTALFFLLFSLVVLLSFLIKAGNNYYNYTVSVQGMEKNISDTISTLRKVNDVLLPPNKRNEFLLKRAQFYSDQAGGNIELLKSAGEDFSRYLKRVPNDIRALIKRAGVNLKLNRLNEVRADLLLVRRLQPSDVSLLLECAELNVRLKNFTEAQSCLARAFKLDPKNINILLRKTIC